MAIAITEGTVPDQDDTPDLAPVTDATEATGWFNPEYPHSTQEHPYGYFPVSTTDDSPDFSRPRKRRPHNRTRSSGDSVATSARADTTAKTAAKMLSRMNGLVGMALISFGMPLSGQAINDANNVFEEMAYEALQTDPALARKILSAGATSGKSQLIMAYVMLGGQVAPAAYMEIKSRRETDDDDA